MKILSTFIICLGLALFGQHLVGDIPVANWMCGALAGIIGMTICVYD